jgi:hypothetical protein
VYARRIVSCSSKSLLSPLLIFCPLALLQRCNTCSTSHTCLPLPFRQCDSYRLAVDICTLTNESPMGDGPAAPGILNDSGGYGVPSLASLSELVLMRKFFMSSSMVVASISELSTHCRKLPSLVRLRNRSLAREPI